MDRITFGGPLSVVTSRLASGTVQVAFVGEIDLASAEVVRTALSRLIGEAGAAGEVGEVLVDLSGVSFLDAVGIGELVHARRSAAAAGISLELHSPRGAVGRVLSVPAIARELPVIRERVPGRARGRLPGDRAGQPWTLRTAPF